MEYELESIWDLWFHSITNTSWDKSSYQKIYTINSILDYRVIIDIFKQNHYQNGMFFIMKSGVFPNWEDPSNRLGGCLSFKISSNRLIRDWNSILLRCLKGEILKKNNNTINGLSISPKKEFNIIKIWFSEDTNYNELYIPPDNGSEELILDNSLYKKNMID